jgi:hypothetical protein
VHPRPVRIVERLEQDHLVAHVAERLDRREDQLRRPAADDHLRVRVVVDTFAPGDILRDAGVQGGDTGHAAVLIVAGAERADRRFLEEVGAVLVGEALGEVDGAVLLGEAGHLGEDGGAVAGEAAGEGGDG